ncbi:MAG: glycosyltransferase family 4 protein [Solirubrobacteraceae bacterium]|nr:glycosyltransferase family 4 protein [Solirubrobacteraceae bacterium]
MSAPSRPPVPGVNVIGQFRAESGIGEAARSVVAALDAVGMPVLPALPPETSPSRQGVAFDVVPLSKATFPVTLSLLTAYETGPLVAAAPDHITRGQLVGLWWWEVEDLPDFMAEAFAHVDAVWAGTEHVQRALARSAGDTPVDRIRYAVRRPEPTGVDREALGLPTDGCLFLTLFGFYSAMARKNPQGTIAAFVRAFPRAEPGGPQLVVKVIDEDAHPAELAALEALIAPHPHVHLLTGYRDRSGIDDLLAAADVVVSLHRAEGFGYAPAEAMALGRTALATGYSGNLDYMNAENSVLVPAEVVPIGPEGAPYPAESRWAEPDLAAAADAMRQLAADPARRAALGAHAAADMAAGFTDRAAGESILAALARLPETPARPSWWARRRADRLAAELRRTR